MEFCIFGPMAIEVYRQKDGRYVGRAITRTPANVRRCRAWAEARGLKETPGGNYWEQMPDTCKRVRGIGGRRSLRRDWVLVGDNAAEVA